MGTVVSLLQHREKLAAKEKVRIFMSGQPSGKREVFGKRKPEDRPAMPTYTYEQPIYDPSSGQVGGDAIPPYRGDNALSTVMAESFTADTKRQMGDGDADPDWWNFNKF